MTDLAELTTRLAPAIEAVIEAEVTRREGRRTLEKRIRHRTRDQKIDAACNAIAAAVDELEAARFSGAPEIPARRKLEKSCKTLWKVMRGRPR